MINLIMNQGHTMTLRRSLERGLHKTTPSGFGQTRQLHLEPLEDRRVLDASLGIQLLDHFAYPGETVTAEWFISKSLADTDASGAIESEELSQIHISVDGLGILANQIEFTPTLDENAFIDLYGDLRGVLSMPVPSGVPADSPLDVWMTVSVTESAEILPVGSGALASPSASTGPGTTVFSTRSDTQAVTAPLITDGVSAFVSHFGQTINGQPSVSWLNDYIDTLYPSLSNYPGSREYLLDRFAAHAVLNDKATLAATGQQPSLLAQYMPQVLKSAYGGMIGNAESWNPSKPTIVLVHGINTNPQEFHQTALALKEHVPNANVLSFAWGRSGFLNGLQRSVFDLLRDADSAPSPLSAILSPLFYAEELDAYKEAQLNLTAAIDLHLLIKLLNRAYGPSAAENVNIVAHSQGTVVTTAALMLGNNPSGPTINDDPYYINRVLFMGSNLHFNATESEQEFDYIAAQIGQMINLYSEKDHIVYFPQGLLGIGAGTSGFFPRRPEVVTDINAYSIPGESLLGFGDIEHYGDNGWWMWLQEMQRSQQYLDTRFEIPSVGSETTDRSSEALRVGATPVQLVDDPKVIVTSSSQFDIPVRGVQVRAPSVPLPTQPIVPPSLASISITPNPAFRGELLIVETAGVAAASGRTIVRADAYLDLNDNQQIDPGEYLNSDHDPTGGWRILLSTEEIGTGTKRILVRVADDQNTLSIVRSTTIQIVEPGSPPNELPANISASADSKYQIIPHENGDVSYDPAHYSVGPGKVDLWEIRPTHGGGFTFTTTGDTDTVLGLYNRATGQLLEFDEDNATGSNNAEIVVTLDAGVAYVLAVASQRGDAGNYGLDVIGVDQVVDGVIATPPSLYQGTAGGTIATSYDTRYFKLDDVPAGATSLTVRMHSSSTLNGFVRVENAAHETVRTSFQNGVGLDDVVTDIPVTPGEDLYITVTGIEGSTGSFTLDVDFNPDDPGLPDDLAPVPDSPLLVMLPDGSLSVPDNEISTGGEIDYYFLSTQPGETGEFFIETTGDLDTQVALYRRLGSHFAEFVADDDDSGAGLNSRVTATLLAGEVYVIAVRADGNETGTYDLLIGGRTVAVVPLSVSGLTLARTTLPASLSNGERYTHYSITAPQGATSLDIATEILPGSETLDIGLRVTDATGAVVAMLDSAGPGVNEQATLPVVAGMTYYITTWSADLGFGSYRLNLDFDPDFQVAEGIEFPINSSALSDERAPDVAMNAAGQSVVVWEAGSGDDDIVFQRFDVNGAAAGPETMANQTGDSFNRGPAVGIDASGDFVVAWISEGDVVVRRFDASGAPLSGSIVTGLNAVTYLDIAVQANGKFMVVASDGTSLQGRLFDSAGSPITSALVLDDTADEVGDTTISADGSGNYVVAWNVYSDDGATLDAYVIRIDPTGNAIPSGRHEFVAGEIRGRRFEDTNSNGVQGIGEPSVDGVTVLLDANGNGVQDGGELTQVTNADGDYVFSGVPVGAYHVVQLAGPASGPAVLSDDFDRADSGDPGPEWLEQNGDLRIEGDRLRVQPGTIGNNSWAAYQPFDGTQQAVTFDLDYDTAAGERFVNGQVYLAYADTNHYVGVRFSDNSIDGQSQFYRLSFVAGDGSSSDAWPRQRGGPQAVDVTPFSSARILAVYDPTSSTLTVGIDREFDGVYETVLTRGGILPDGLGTKVAIGGYNNVAIDNFTVDTNWQVMPPPNAAPTEAFRVAPGQTQDEGPPDVAAHPDGTFVVAFEANDTDGSGRNIYVQRFDADSQPNGPLSRANSLVDGEQIEATVAIVSQGKYLVGWTTEDSDAKGVAVQLFDIAGNPSGPEFLINEYEADIQQRLVLASDGDERYFGAWESLEQDLVGFGIYGRQLTVDTLLEAELTVVDSSGPSEDRLVEFEAESSSAMALVASPAVDDVHTIVIRNDGNRALTVTSLDIYGEDAEFFALSDDAGFTLQPDETRELTVDFLATSPGEYFAALRIFHDDMEDALSGQFDANPYWISLLGEVPDLVPPTVMQVLVSSTSPWDASFLAQLGAASADLGGYAVPVGTGEQLRALLWTNVDQIKIAFSEDVVVAETDLTVWGTNVAEYEFLPDGFSYNAETFVATWTLASVAGADKLQLVLSSEGITDAAGNELDGEWTNPTALTEIGTDTFPSGDGNPGGDFTFRLNVVPGDVDGNNGVNFGDYLQTRALVGSVAGGEGYDPRFDVDGNGGINFGDALLTRGAVGSVLPTEEPAVPTAPTPVPGSGGGTVLETSLPAHATQIISTGVAPVLTTGTIEVTVSDVATNGPPQEPSTESLEATSRTSAPVTIATEESAPPEPSPDVAVVVKGSEVLNLRETSVAILRARDAVLAALAAPEARRRTDLPEMIVGTIVRQLPQFVAPTTSNKSAVTRRKAVSWESLVDAAHNDRSNERTFDDTDKVEFGFDVHPLGRVLYE